MAKWFINCNSLDELKAQYRKLAMKYHPDRGGDTATMQQINAEHDRLFEVLKRNHNRNADAHHQTTETAEEFRNIVDKLMHMGGLKIELCGSWLWISGATLQHKAGLKAAGCMWSANKKMWYWRHPENARPHRGRSKSMDYIRTKYGSQVIDDDRKTA